MKSKFVYKVLDYINIQHHNSSDVENLLNIQYGKECFELIGVLDMGENNTNKDGKSSRFRYIFKKNEK